MFLIIYAIFAYATASKLEMDDIDNNEGYPPRKMEDIKLIDHWPLTSVAYNKHNGIRSCKESTIEKNQIL